MLLFYAGDRGTIKNYICIKKDTEHTHKHTTASSVSFYQVKSQDLCLRWPETWGSEALLSLPRSPNLFSECCLRVCVVNVQRCGWPSGIWSGSVSALGCGAADVRRCNNAILCVSLCWPILDLAEGEGNHSIMCVHTAAPKLLQSVLLQLEIEGVLRAKRPI